MLLVYGVSWGYQELHTVKVGFATEVDEDDDSAALASSARTTAAASAAVAPIEKRIVIACCRKKAEVLGGEVLEGVVEEAQAGTRWLINKWMRVEAATVSTFRLRTSLADTPAYILASMPPG